MNITEIPEVIKEKKIIVFSPHYDDFVFFLGGYIYELEKHNLQEGKVFTNINVFSRSNYQARQDEGNKDTSLERIKYAVGNRVIEDLCCLDELLGAHNFTYRLLGENESQVREKVFADSDMEFPHGMYDDFEQCDWDIFNRVKAIVSNLAQADDTALVFPVGFKEHIDHFIVREAGLAAAKERNGRATYYFAEDKPYAGISDEAEHERVKAFIADNKLIKKTFMHHPQRLIDLTFKHYVSQVEEVYITGINNRVAELKALYGIDYPVDQIYVFPK